MKFNMCDNKAASQSAEKSGWKGQSNYCCITVKLLYVFDNTVPFICYFNRFSSCCVWMKKGFLLLLCLCLLLLQCIHRHTNHRGPQNCISNSNDMKWKIIDRFSLLFYCESLCPCKAAFTLPCKSWLGPMKFLSASPLFLPSPKHSPVNSTHSGFLCARVCACVCLGAHGSPGTVSLCCQVTWNSPCPKVCGRGSLYQLSLARQGH